MSTKDSPTPDPAPLVNSTVDRAGSPGLTGIDPRGPRFGAAITSVLLLTVIGLGLGGADSLPATVAERASQPAFILFSAIAVLFAWGAFAGIGRHPYGLIFKHVIRPRLSTPSHLEDPRPPTFSQGVGFVITAVGIVLQLIAVPFGLVIFAGLAFIAAFLNAVFDYCLGCQLHVLLVRAGVFGRTRSTS